MEYPAGAHTAEPSKFFVVPLSASPRVPASAHLGGRVVYRRSILKSVRLPGFLVGSAGAQPQRIWRLVWPAPRTT